MKDFFTAIFAIIVTLSLLFGLGLLFNLVDLQFLGWRTNMETHITRQTNAYLTAHQTALRELKSSYDALPADADAQKKGIIRQMREEADLIQNDVQPDISAFLQTH